MSINTERDERLRIASEQANALIGGGIISERLLGGCGVSLQTLNDPNSIGAREVLISAIVWSAFDVADRLIRHADNTTDMGEDNAQE